MHASTEKDTSAAKKRLTQAAGDVLLGWLTAEGLDGRKRDFHVRQLWDGKGSAEIESMGPETMAGHAGLCGWSLARAHARTGDRQMIAAYLGKSDTFDRAIAESPRPMRIRTRPTTRCCWVPSETGTQS